MLTSLQFSEGIADEYDTTVQLNKDFDERPWPGLTRTLKGNESSVDTAGRRGD